MNREFHVFFIVMSLSASSFGQVSKFQELSDRMFFNIFIHQPDSSVYPFLNKYYPHFTEKLDSSGWTMYQDIELPDHYPVINSFQFSRHPFFEALFNEGQLDVLSYNTKDGEPWSIRDFHLWFIFSDKREAENGFEKLCELFHEVSKTKRVFNISGRKVAQYSVTDKIGIVDTVEFVLTEDELRPDRYKLFFRLGAMTYSE